MKKILGIYIFIFSMLARGEMPPRFQLLEDQNCNYKKNYSFLTDSDKKNLEIKSNQKIFSNTIRRLDVFCKDGKSSAYILNDKVRTHYQTLLIWLNGNKLKGIEVLEFNEPKKYQAPTKWVNTIYGLSIKEVYQVDALSGATLTRQSTLKLVKRAFILAK